MTGLEGGGGSSDRRQDLPVSKMKAKLMEEIQRSQITIVVAETGSGKSTQIPQFLMEYTQGGIACTQPRRVAATSLAERVAEEGRFQLGQEVGYRVALEDCTSPATKISFMTDGMLLREAQGDGNFSKYSCIMLDEAHEATLCTDLLIGLLKSALKERPELRLVISSATIHAESFSSFFDGAPIFKVPGRTWSVEICHEDNPVEDPVGATTVDKIVQVHLTEPAGDILVFLPGQEDIEAVCSTLNRQKMTRGSALDGLSALPFHASLPDEAQRKVFQPTLPGQRKIVVATNLAETSLTIDGIVFIIDCGLVKEKDYDPKSGMSSLHVTTISQAQAAQRAGRTGRTKPGKVFRLYTAAQHSKMHPCGRPAMKRSNLAQVVLTLKSLGVNPQSFPFLNLPTMEQMNDAFNQLWGMKALTETGLLTEVGRKMAIMPLPPNVAHMLVNSTKIGCSDEILTIASMMDQNDVFERPTELRRAAYEKMTAFDHPGGDLLTLLKVYKAWSQNDCRASWCVVNFIDFRKMNAAKQQREHLEELMRQQGLLIVSCGSREEVVQTAICETLKRNIARKARQGGYWTEDRGCHLVNVPFSSVFSRIEQPDVLYFEEVVQTTDQFMRRLTVAGRQGLDDGGH